jgi:arylsulfatase A-like enzyme
MKLKTKYIQISLGFLSGFLVIANSFAQTAGSDPNIVLIFADDLGYADVGFNRVAGSPSEYIKYGAIPTPALDDLASNGMVFSEAHVAHPFCGPSRAALLTGVYPHRIGSQYNLPNDINTTLGIPTSEVFFTNLLQDSNYYTAMVGKWHLGHAAGFDPNSRGFTDFLGFLGGGHNYFENSYETNFWNKQNDSNPSNDITNEYQVPLKRNQNYVAINDYAQDEYLTDILSYEAVNFINGAPADKPFFLYVAYNAPHTPLDAPADKITTFDNANGDGSPGSTFSTVIANSPDILNANIPSGWAGTDEEYRAELVQDRLTYATMVSIMDEGIGNIKAALTTKGILNNTLIVFLSDNGGKLDQAGAVNYPLNQGKGSVDEGGHRVPMLMHWPGTLPVGTYPHLVSSLDLYPTFVNLAGATLPGGKLLEGVDIMPHVIANTNGRGVEPLYAMRPLGDASSGQDGFQNVSIKLDNWKIVKKASAAWTLYDMDTDISEVNNLANSPSSPDGQAIIDQLIAKAIVWVKDFKDEKPGFYDLYDHQHIEMWDDGRLPSYDSTFGTNELLLESEISEISITGITDAIEGEVDGLFTVSLPSGVLADQDIIVDYLVSGNASNGVDYTLLSGSVTIPNGSNSSDITIVASADSDAEVSETVTITLDNTSWGTLNTTPANITIFDPNAPTTLTAGDVAIVGYKAAAGNVGELAFLLFKDINAGTSLSFSNRSWKDDGSFNTGGGGAPFGIDDVFSWTATDAHAAGTIFKLGSNGKVTTVIGGIETEVGNSVQTFGTDSDWDLSPVGDSVLIYNGNTSSHPANGSSTWVTGLNTNGVDNGSGNLQDAGWAVGGGNAYCELPLALVGFDIDVTGGDYTLNLWDINHGVYIGGASGDATTIRASINNYQNWQLDESNAYFLWNSDNIVGSDNGNIILGQLTLSSNIADKIDFDLKVFPNPSRDNFNLNFNRGFDTLEIEILSSTGQLIKKVNINTTNPKIDASFLPTGLYILRIKADDNFIIEKIIKL